jgi:Tol biopolymer transport system component
VFARNGKRFAYSQFYIDTNIWRMDNTTGESRQFIMSTQSESSPQYSSDGKRVAFRSSQSGHNEIWVADVDSPSTARQLTRIGSTLTGCPRWSPDGRSIAADSRPDGPAHIFIIDASTGDPKQLTTGSSEDVVPSWSNDGNWIYFSSNRSGTWQIWKIAPTGGTAVQVTHQGGFAPFESPDGRHVYYAKGRTVSGLWRVPVEGGPEEQVLSRLKPGYWGYWGLCNDSLYFVDKEAPRSPAALFRYELSSRKLTRLHDIVKPPIVGDSGLAISPDCRATLYTQRDQSGSDIMLANLSPKP